MFRFKTMTSHYATSYLFDWVWQRGTGWDGVGQGGAEWKRSTAPWKRVGQSNAKSSKVGHSGVERVERRSGLCQPCEPYAGKC